MKILYVVHHFVKARDGNGNVYHAFRVYDTETGKSVARLHDCASNVKHALGYGAIELETVLPAREFQRQTQGWKYWLANSGDPLREEIIASLEN